jgi:serine/threonine protein phosphatase 1
MDAELYARNGGAWNIANTAPERLVFSDALGSLPLAIEIETAAGLVGIVHADCPFVSWQEFTTALGNPALSAGNRKAIREAALWSRDRIETEDLSCVDGVVAVVVGHTPQDAPRWLGNVLYVDTAAWYRAGAFDREFAIFDLATLQPAAKV